jgi:hypothetical protein
MKHVHVTYTKKLNAFLGSDSRCSIWTFYRDARFIYLLKGDLPWGILKVTNNIPISFCTFCETAIQNHRAKDCIILPQNVTEFQHLLNEVVWQTFRQL